MEIEKILVSTVKQDIDLEEKREETIYSRLFGGIFSTIEEYPGIAKSEMYIRATKMLDEYMSSYLNRMVLEKDLVNWINSPILDKLGVRYDRLSAVFSTGHIPLVEWYLDRLDTDLQPDAFFDDVCSSGKIDFVKWFLTKFPRVNASSNAFSQAVINGNLALGKWLLERYPYIKVDLSPRANLLGKLCLKRNQKDVLWFMEHYPSASASTEDLMACFADDPETLEVVLRKKNKTEREEDDWLFRYACSKGYLEVAKWFVKKYPDADVHRAGDVAFCWACSGGHFNVVEWFLDTFPETKIIISFVHSPTMREYLEKMKKPQEKRRKLE